MNSARRLSKRASAGIARVSSSRFAIVYTGLFAFLCAAALTLIRGWPALPAIHDESSFLLSADTFAHGRLTNPTPPLGDHFETFHVLVRPSYASKYPPAQGLMLAIGQVLGGAPIIGVWLSAGILAAALTWMLRGWFRGTWAVVGSVLITLMLAGSVRDGYWFTTFWGGTVAGIGAALLYGAARRLTRTPSVLAAALFAVGLGILALSRPFEGLLVAIPALVGVGTWLLRDKRSTPTWRMRRILAPMAVVIAAIGAFSLYYDARVTGNALRLPYMEYEAQYGGSALFVFMPPKAVNAAAYSNPEMLRFYSDPAEQRSIRTPMSLLRADVGRVIQMQRFLAPGLLLVLVVLGVTGIAWRTLTMPFAGIGLVLGGAFLVTWYWPHYIAPVIAPWAILLTQGARRLALLQPRASGRKLLWLVLGMAALTASVTAMKLYVGRAQRFKQWPVQRNAIARELESHGGRHLVLVSYGPKHSFHNEWVYNRARLEEAPVIWARSLSLAKDSLLSDHFQDRFIWRLQVDSDSTHMPLQPVSQPLTADATQR